ncbi:MAG TPA: hypothetical protein VMF65_10095 [Acidimicrobiales bacterium]|nr:hypothetical protein [Acidimicrobiales bacterium]
MAGVGAMLQSAGLPACAWVGEVVDLARRLCGARHSLAELGKMSLVVPPRMVTAGPDAVTQGVP